MAKAILGRSRHVAGLAGALLATAALAACAESPQQKALESTPAYEAGYGAGCRSGRNTAGDPQGNFVKDEARFASDAAYRQGWNDAFETCSADAEAEGGPLTPSATPVAPLEVGEPLE